MDVGKGIIYYSDGLIKDPIRGMCLDSITTVGLPVAMSVLADPTQRGYPMMLRQIIECLTQLSTKYVFFCEHDVIYNPSHFDFTPPRDDIFYYNNNVWRWDYPHDRYITYDQLISLSGMCADRQLCVDHFTARLKHLQERGYDKHHSGEPGWLRTLGYEPGTKKKKVGGFSNDDFETWRSAEPLIDIRHKGTFSPRKVHLNRFRHQPTGWREQHERP